MKILQINSVCGTGSTGRIATDIYRVLLEQGHECLIAYGRGTAPEGINAYRIGSDLGVKFHGIYTRLTDKAGFASKKATEKLVEIIKEYNPDVIQLHNIHGYYINIKILFDYLCIADKPVIWTMHDCWAFTGHCAYFDYVGCDKWKVECDNCLQKKSYPSSLMLDNSKWNYSVKKVLFTSVKNMTLVIPSKWLAGLVKESFLRKYPVKVINNGIDLSKFKPASSDFRERYGLENKIILLGVASIWNKRKGLDSFLELSQTLNENYKIVIVGVTKRQKRHLPDSIIGIMKTNNVQELAEIYTSADIFINPTLEDNFPTTNLEALACGTPVITYDTGGSPESVDRNCGAIIEQGNYSVLVEAILELRNKEIASGDCTAKAASYDMQSLFNEYINMYNKVIIKT